MKAKTLCLSELCNNNCLFCSARGRLASRTLDEVKNILQRAKELGVDRIDISGGEPTEHPDILEVLKTCKIMGFKEIHLKTNGRRLKDKEFLEKILDSGANGFLFSVHGHIPEIHDRITGKDGSLAEALQGIQNLTEIDPSADFGTLTVINRLNFRHLREIAELMISLGTKIHVFVFIFPISRALENFDQVVPYYFEVKDFVLNVLKLNGGDTSKIKVKIDNYPFCLMPGLEKFSNMILVDQMEYPDNIKGEKCKECFYLSICEGIPREYIGRRGWFEFQPVNKEKIPARSRVYSKTIDDNDTMVLKSQFMEREWGGILFGRDICLLTRHGAMLIKEYKGILPLMEIYKRFGSSALGFAFNLESRGLMRMVKSVKKSRENILKIEIDDPCLEFEFSLKIAA